MLIMMYGQQATGKTTLGRRIAGQLSCAFLSSHLVRAEDRHRPEFFDNGYRLKVYQTLMIRAEPLLASRADVVIDAMFNLRAYRVLGYSLAARYGTIPIVFECQAHPAAVEERVARRFGSLRPEDEGNSMQYHRMRLDETESVWLDAEISNNASAVITYNSSTGQITNNRHLLPDELLSVFGGD